ncbi:unnamed protein product, partial [Mesorhabditis spiculigera]
MTDAWKLHITPNGDRLENQKSGDNFLVVCQVQEYDGPASDVKIDWYRKGTKIQFGRIMTVGKPNASQLMIINAKKDDSDDFVCKAEIAGETQETSAKINFIQAPKFVDARLEQHPEEGKAAEIVCRVTGEPQMEVFWQFNGNTLDESSPRGYEFKENNQILVIPNYDSKKDDGHYLCNAAQFSSFETLTINVSGYSRPIITVFDGPTNNRGFEGHSVQFKCGAIGKPMPTYKWFRGETNDEIVKSDIHSVEDGLLVIHSLNGGDNGDYRCEATNAIGSDAKTATLSVYLRPKVERVANHTKESGESVEIVCRYAGEGNLKAKFIHGDQTYKVASEEEETEEKLMDEEDEAETEEAEHEPENLAAPENEATNEEEEDDEKEEKTEEAEDNKEDEEKKEDEDEGNNEEGDDKEQDKEEDEDEKAEDEMPDVSEADHENQDQENDHDDEAGAENKEDEEDVTPKPGHHEDETPEENDNDDGDNTNDDEHEQKEEHDDRAHDDSGHPIAMDEDVTDEENGHLIDAGDLARWKRDVQTGRVSIQDDGKQITLSIRDVSLNDAGLYQCVVENEAGPITRNSILAITHAPIIKKHSRETIRTFDDNEVELFCEGKAVPEPNWTWEINGDEVEADGVLVRINNTATRSAVIMRMAKGRYGTYTCRASNGVGEPATKQFNVIEVVVPAVPSELSCQEHVYPNYAACSLSAEQYADEKSKPSEVEFAYAPSDDVESDFDWEKDSVRQRVNYTEKMRITGLKPNSAYIIRARAINEAGASDMGVQGTIETTDPWAPEKPESITVNCDTSCTIGWLEPNDHGAELSGYKIVVREFEDNVETTEREYVGSNLEIDVAASDEAVELTQLKPNTKYEISVVAENSIGESQPLISVFETPETVVPVLSSGFTNFHIMIIVGVVLLVLFLLVDLICYGTNRCGLIACICVNCCGKNPDRSKDKDLESGRPESNRLLSDSSWNVSIRCILTLSPGMAQRFSLSISRDRLKSPLVSAV